MRRSLFPSLGLGIALVVTLAVGRYVGAQETTKCDACAGWAAMDAKVKDAGGWIDYGKVDNGIVCVALTPKTDKGSVVVDAVQEFDKLTHSKDLKLCSKCEEMEKLARTKGTKVEIIPLQSGALYFMTSTKPKTIEALHTMYDQCKQAMLEGAKATCGNKKDDKGTLLSNGDDDKGDKEKSPDDEKTNDH